MIIAVLINVVFGFLNLIVSVFPSVTILPFGIDSILVQGMGYYRFLMTVFPPLGTMWTGFLFVIYFKLSLRVFRIIPVVGKLLR